MEETLTHVVEELARRGYKEHFQVADARLHALGTGERFDPKDIVIRGYYRFEGVSDPDDMAIVYAIETASGVAASSSTLSACTPIRRSARRSSTSPS